MRPRALTSLNACNVLRLTNQYHRINAWCELRRGLSHSPSFRIASYAYWLKDMAAEQESQPTSPVKKSAFPRPETLSSDRSADAVQESQTTEAGVKISPFEIEIVKLFHQGNYTEMYQRLKQLKADGVVIPTEILNEMVSSFCDNLPVDDTREFLLQSVVEAPIFHTKNDLRLSTRYRHLSPFVHAFHEIFKLYESENLSDTNFLSHYIWLCYHTEDLPTLQRLLYVYLQSTEYDSRTLSYIVNAFVYSYDVEFSKSLFLSILGMGKPLDESLLSSTLVSFIAVGALYDNLYEVFISWLNSKHCESPYPQTVALLAKQTYKYGTMGEIHFVEQLSERLGYQSNFLIQMVETQAKILRSSSSMRKSVSAEDVQAILKSRNSLNSSPHALQVFYETYIYFFCRHSNMSVVQLIMKEMKRDNIPITRRTCDSIVDHYVSRSKYILLYNFLDRFVSKKMNFDCFYVYELFKAFVRTYPYHGAQFAKDFTYWLHKSSDLNDEQKSALDSVCKVNILDSNITPSALAKDSFENSRKYLSPQWSEIKYNRHRPVAKSNKRHQVQFRMIDGIRDVMRRGLRPDFYVLESTLRNSSTALRTSILNILPELRMTQFSSRLHIYHFLMSNPQKSSFASFVSKMEPQMNTSDKLLLARRAMNNYDFKTTALLLESLNKADLDDGKQMISLNLRLRNCIYSNDFHGCIDAIDHFPLNDITLSPYIYDQCIFIEKSLLRKMKTKDQPSERKVIDLVLKKLHGLIGDIKLRLDTDEKEIEELKTKTFTMLSKWARSSTTDT